MISLLGCGESGPSAVAVSGKVTVDGTIWTKGAVRFVPDAEKGNTSTREGTGTIGTDGKYAVSILGKPGAPLGWYKVSVSSGEIPDSANPKASKPPFPARFGEPDKSGLQVEVVRTPASGAYDLKVTTK